MERVQRRQGAMDQSTKGGEVEGVDDDERGGTGRVGEGWREQIGVDDVNYDHARRFPVVYVDFKK